MKRATRLQTTGLSLLFAGAVLSAGVGVLLILLPVSLYDLWLMHRLRRGKTRARPAAQTVTGLLIASAVMGFGFGLYTLVFTVPAMSEGARLGYVYGGFLSLLFGASLVLLGLAWVRLRDEGGV